MRRKRIGEESAGAEERVASEERREAPAEEAEVYPRPHSHRELGAAIFERSNPVKVGCELLEESNDATRLSALRAFADWIYGKYGTDPSVKAPRIIWDIPGPPYEPEDPEA